MASCAAIREHNVLKLQREKGLGGGVREKQSGLFDKDPKNRVER